jgi:putative Mg2+ transporter-C (MgtC) family protein
VNVELPIETQIDLALRLTIGLALGAVIGFEREFHRQPAGFRTHSLVALGAALFTIVGAYAFDGPGADPTRVAAQIVTGIGFIGAGTILQYRGQIRGLTTAASLWSVAAIGMTAGAGLIVLAVVGTVLVLIILSILNRVESLARRHLDLPPEQMDLSQYDRPIDDGRSEDHT